jgi:hypothetical protein
MSKANPKPSSQFKFKFQVVAVKNEDNSIVLQVSNPDGPGTTTAGEITLTTTDVNLQAHIVVGQTYECYIGDPPPPADGGDKPPH